MSFTGFNSIIYFYIVFLDINECLTNPCGNNAACFNNPGSFSCQCAAGYTSRPSGCVGKETCEFLIRFY